MPPAPKKQQSTLSFSSTGRLTVRQPPTTLSQQPNVGNSVNIPCPKQGGTNEARERPTSTFFGHLMAPDMNETGSPAAGPPSQRLNVSQQPSSPSYGSVRGVTIKQECSPSPPRQSTIPFNTQKLRWIPYDPVQAIPSASFPSKPQTQRPSYRTIRPPNPPPPPPPPIPQPYHSQIPIKQEPQDLPSHIPSHIPSRIPTTPQPQPTTPASHLRQQTARTHAQTTQVQTQRDAQKWTQRFSHSPKSRWRAYTTLHRIEYPEEHTFEPEPWEETICREYCKLHFGLTQADLQTLPYNPQPNPIDESYAAMKLHRLHDVCDLAFRKCAVLAGERAELYAEEMARDGGGGARDIGGEGWEDEELLGRGRDIFVREYGTLNDILNRLDTSIQSAIIRNEKRRAEAYLQTVSSFPPSAPSQPSYVTTTAFPASSQPSSYPIATAFPSQPASATSTQQTSSRYNTFNGSRGGDQRGQGRRGGGGGGNFTGPGRRLGGGNDDEEEEEEEETLDLRGLGL